MSWLYGEPVEGDISEFRLVRMSFCHGADNEYIMHKDHVGRFVEASVKLHHSPGINPANKEPTARIWRITSAPLHGHSYWWTTPSLEGNDDPEGAVIVKGGPSETVFIDREYVARINREEDDLEDDDNRSRETVVAPATSDPAQEPEAVALKPCPFCGSSDSFAERYDYSSTYVMCNNCSAHGPTELQEDDLEETPGEEAAKRAWNTRPVSLDREAIGRRLYDCEKQRGERAQSVMAAAYGKPCHGILMEPWDECKDSFLSDADAIIALIEGRA